MIYECWGIFLLYTLNTRWHQKHWPFTDCTCSYNMIFPRRAEGECSYVPCRLSSAGWAGGRGSQAGRGGVQPGPPVNVEVTEFPLVVQNTFILYYKLFMYQQHLIFLIWLTMISFNIIGAGIKGLDIDRYIYLYTHILNYFFCLHNNSPKSFYCSTLSPAQGLQRK